MRRFRSFDHSTLKTVLNLLEAVYLRFRKIVVKRVTVVKFTVDSRGSDDTGCFRIKVRTDTGELTNMRIAGLRKCWDLIRESKIFIKDRTKVACRMSGVVYFRKLLFKTNNEKFSLGRVNLRARRSANIDRGGNLFQSGMEVGNTWVKVAMWMEREKNIHKDIRRTDTTFRQGVVWPGSAVHICRLEYSTADTAFCLVYLHTQENTQTVQTSRGAAAFSPFLPSRTDITYSYLYHDPLPDSYLLYCV